MRIDTAAIEPLKQFAEQNGEIEFAHLCTAALQGEEWAIERVSSVIARLTDSMLAASLDTMSPADRRYMVHVCRIDVIRSTDCTRLDGSIARAAVIP